LNRDYGAGAGADSELAGGASVAGGWGWAYWERFELSLSWAEYKTYAEGPKRRGQLLTLAEARALLRHQTLCPGEDRWVAVLPDATPQHTNADRGGSGAAASQVALGEAHAHGAEEGGGGGESEGGFWGGTSLDKTKRRQSFSGWVAATAAAATATAAAGALDEEVEMDWVQVRDFARNVLRWYSVVFFLNVANCVVC
jgi:hypothetical protein